MSKVQLTLIYKWRRFTYLLCGFFYTQCPLHLSVCTVFIGYSLCAHSKLTFVYQLSKWIFIALCNEQKINWLFSALRVSESCQRTLCGGLTPLFCCTVCHMTKNLIVIDVESWGQSAFFILWKRNNKLKSWWWQRSRSLHLGRMMTLYIIIYCDRLKRNRIKLTWGNVW